MNRVFQSIVLSCLLISAPAFADIAVDEREEAPKVEAEAKPDEAKPDEAAPTEEKEAKTSGCSTTGGDVALFSVLAGLGLVFVGRKRQ